MDNIIGHDSVKRYLLDNKSRTTWLMYGKKGIGKATLAKSFAIYITENTKHTNISYFSNILVIENETIKIEEIRNIKNFLYLSSVNQYTKIVIIDSIDNLTINAANSILKILEEPPKNSIIILISHNYHKVTQTIKSRCFPLSLSPLSLQETLEVLERNKLAFNQTSDLLKFYNGTPGMITNTTENEVKLYYNLLAIILGNDRISQIEETINLDVSLHKIGLIASHLILNIVKNIIGIKKDTIKNTKKTDINFWINRYSLFQHLINSAEKFNLDKKHLILVLIYYLKIEN